jgi:hypothetical protein
VDEPHFNFRVNRPGPISTPSNFERHHAVVNNTVFGREALQALEADVAHGCEEFKVVLRNILLSGERSIQAIEGRSIPDDVVGVKIERRFDFIDYLTMKVLFHACQVASNTVVVHRFPIRILVVTNPQLMLAAIPFLSKVCSSLWPNSAFCGVWQE